MRQNYQYAVFLGIFTQIQYTLANVIAVLFGEAMHYHDTRNRIRGGIALNISEIFLYAMVDFTGGVRNDDKRICAASQCRDVSQTIRVEALGVAEQHVLKIVPEVFHRIQQQTLNTAEQILLVAFVKIKICHTAARQRNSQRRANRPSTGIILIIGNEHQILLNIHRHSQTYSALTKAYGAVFGNFSGSRTVKRGFVKCQQTQVVLKLIRAYVRADIVILLLLAAVEIVDIRVILPLCLNLAALNKMAGFLNFLFIIKPHTRNFGIQAFGIGVIMAIQFDSLPNALQMPLIGFKRSSGSLQLACLGVFHSIILIIIQLGHLSADFLNFLVQILIARLQVIIVLPINAVRIGGELLFLLRQSREAVEHFGNLICHNSSPCLSLVLPQYGSCAKRC